MNIRKIIKLSFRQLLVHKSQSFFAIIGLSIGIASVITMTAIGNGAKMETVRQLEKMGTNLMIINAGKVKNVMQRRQKSDLITTLRMKDCEIIRNECPSVKEVVPSLSGSVKIKYGNATTLCMVNGVSASYFKVKNFTCEKGNLFSPLEDKLCQRFAILGCQVSQNIFNKENPVGKTLLIGKVPFIVIGVLKCKGITSDGANLDVQVLIPINTALRRIFNADYLNRIFVEVSDRNKLTVAEEEITSVLRDSHKLDIRKKENDFTIDNQLSDIKVSESSAQSFTLLIIGVSAIALLVGGIGILAVMLLSVKERNSEIGLRLSVGAKRKDIVKQFLAESAMLGFAGGLTGLTIGSLVSITVGVTTQWHIQLSLTSIGISILFSIFTGMIFGVIPARKASQIDPIIALQKE
jgi:putative ABC transport system permease protein